MNSKKAAICIDNGYFGRLCFDKGFPAISFSKFVEHIAKKNNLGEYTPYIYDCMPHQSRIPTAQESARYAKKDKFFSALKKKGFVIRLGKLQKVGNGFKQKKVDTLWTADICALSYKKEIDTVLIVSGDSDFIPGVANAKEAGVHTSLWYGESQNTGTSLDLIKTCAETHKITDDILELCRL